MVELFDIVSFAVSTVLMVVGLATVGGLALLYVEGYWR